MRYLLILLLLTSCGAYKQRILDKYCNPTGTAKIDTILNVKVEVADSGETHTFVTDCESLQRKYDSLLSSNKAVVIGGDTLVPLHSDSTTDVYFKPLPGNKKKFVTVPKKRLIEADATVPVSITVPCDCPDCPELNQFQHARKAPTFLIIAFFIGLALGLYMQIRR
jgi:hypothetical protein